MCSFKDKGWVIKSGFILLVAFFFHNTLYGAPVSTASKLTPSQQAQHILPLEARSAVLAEPETGSILFEYNADERIPPASLTKILTLYIVFEALEKGAIHLDDEVYISHRAWKTGGSQMFLEVGRRVPLEELIKGIAVVSGNDACVAVAEHIAGTVESFVALMNQKAQELGLTQSHFANPHGLPDPNEYSTARDLARLAIAYINRFPQALSYHSMKEFTFNNIVQYNRNHLLNKDPSVDGLKTGFVAAGGYHLIATAKRDGMRLIAVVLGTSKPSIRERDAMQLLSYGFRSYTLIKPVNSSEAVGSVRVWKGEKNSVTLYPLESKALLVPKGEEKKVKISLDIPSELVAPLRAGQTVGQVTVYRADEVVDTIPIVVGEDIARGGFFKRTWHFFQRLFTKGSEPSSFRLPDWKTLLKYSVGVVIFFILLLLLIKLLRLRHRKRKSSLPRRVPRKF